MEIGDILVYMFIFAVAIALILLFTGNFFDLRVEIVFSRQSMFGYSILNDFLSSSEKFFDRALILRSDLNKVDNKFNILEYDYVINLSNNYYKNFDGPNKLFAFDSRAESCYNSVGMLIVNEFQSFYGVCDDKFSCEANLATIKIARTPLSELAYWLTVACTSKDNIVKLINIMKKDYSNINVDLNMQKICIDNYCKNFYCNKKIEIESKPNNEDCKRIEINSKNDIIKLTLP